MLIIAHRGASGYAPENTLAAMKLAIRQKCDGIELDVQMTKDGKIVVFHDWSLQRTSNGCGEIKDITYEEIRELDAGSWFSEDFKGEKIPTLEEVLNLIPHELLLNIEIKAKASDNRGIEAKVADIIEKHNRYKNTIVSSFNHKCIKRIKKHNCKIEIGILYEGYIIKSLSYIKESGLCLYSCHPNYNYVNEKLVKMLKEKKLKIFAWTVNDLKEGNELKKIGVDGIITNYPDIFR